ncbi:MAG: hypothetical protein J6J18_07035 [Oscillospiraceae bacterium]|nr:hypothetical protein [Oscillospiraceae bacterium]
MKLVKQTNTGKNLVGWLIGLYYDSACTKPVSGSPFTTGTNGTITVSGLKPGTLYAKEIPTDDPYWEFDTSVKEIKIVANQTATVSFTNTHFGRIKFQKTTNTGNHLGGWTFRVTDANGNHVGDYTTDENGEAYTGNLPLGRYTVQELSVDDDYWNCELGFHDVTVKAGETVVDEWQNKEQGLGWFRKTTNTGEHLSGWEITVYSDEACTQKVCTVTTDETGKTGHYLDPGIFYAKETGDTLGRYSNEYWLIDKTVYRFEIKPHEETTVTFSNTHYGKLNIHKTMDSTRNENDYKLNRIGIQVGGGLGIPDREVGIYRSILCSTPEPTSAQVNAVTQKVQSILSQIDMGQWTISDVYVQAEEYGENTRYTIVVHAVPVFEGIPALYGQKLISNTSEENVAPNYPISKMEFYYSADGRLAYFDLNAPIETIQTINTNVATLPMEELISKAENYLSLFDAMSGIGTSGDVLYLYQDTFQEKILCRVDITQIRLEMARIRVPNTDDRYYYTPALVVKGSAEYYGEKTGMVYVRSSDYYPGGVTLAIVNAVDGSIPTKTENARPHPNLRVSL